MRFGIFDALRKLGLSTLIRIISLILLNKAFAFYYGAEGILLFSQVNNFISLVLILSTLGLGNGIMRTIVDLGVNNEKSFVFIKNTRNFLLLIIFTISLLTFFLNDNLSLFFFNTRKYSYLIGLTFLIALASVFNTLFVSIVTARLKFKIYNIVSNIYHLILLLGTIFLFTTFGFQSAILLIFFSQILNLFIIILVFKNDPWFLKLFQNFSLTFEWNCVKLLLPFLLISLVSGISAPITLTVIRNSLIEFGGEKLAGHWEALSRISGVSLTFFTAMLGTYLVPTISSLKSEEEVPFLHKSLIQLSLLIIPIIILINFFSKFIILIMFSKEFMIIDNNILIQSLGDYFKGLSLLFAYFMISNKMTFLFIFLEIIASIIFVFFSQYFIVFFGFIGVSYAYLLTYLAYFSLAYFRIVYFRK